MTALGFLLAKAGVGVGEASGVIATVMSPTFWGFLLSPFMDVGLTRRAYAFATALLSALFIAIGVWVLGEHHIAAATVLLLIAELLTVQYGSAYSGWTSEFVPDEKRGAVAAWLNVANLGAGAAGAFGLMQVAERYSTQWAGIGLAASVCVSALLCLTFPAPRAPQFGIAEVYGRAMRAIWRAVKQRSALVGFALFLSPTAAAAAINLFSTLGRDFHVSAQTVIWVTGAGSAASSSIGSLIGGYTLGKLPRGYVYLVCGMAAAACSLVIAFTPHVAIIFVAGVLAYNLATGGSYAAFSALSLELVGPNNPVASTEMSLFAAATNGAITYMTWADGRGYDAAGLRGLFLTDSLLSLSVGIPLLMLVTWHLRRHQGEQTTGG